MLLPYRFVKFTACSAVVALLGTTAAFGNGLFESRPWQFDTANDKIAKANLLDLRERKKGGFYDGFDTTNNFVTNIAGDQINCNLTASAVGNSGQLAANGSASSPIIDTPGSINADATGNVSTTDTSGFNSTIGTDPFNFVSDSATGSISDPDGQATSNGGQSSSTSQGNTDSPQTAGVDNSSISSNVDNVNASGGVSDVALNSSMTNDMSPQTASVDSSEACGFFGSRDGSDVGSLN
ncbi:MAG: hypothetical protein ACE363_02450 [Alphaproteobacteria bacterium]